MNEGPKPPIQFVKAANDNFSESEKKRIEQEEREWRLKIAEVAFEEKIEEFIEMGLNGEMLLKLQDEVLARQVHIVENSATNRARAFSLLKSIFLEYKEESPDQTLIDSMSANFIKLFKEAYPTS